MTTPIRDHRARTMARIVKPEVVEGRSPLITSFFRPTSSLQSTKQISIEIKKELIKKSEPADFIDDGTKLLPGIRELDVIDLTVSDDEVMEIIPAKSSVECIDLVRDSTNQAKRPRLNNLDTMTAADIQRQIECAKSVQIITKVSTESPINLISDDDVATIFPVDTIQAKFSQQNDISKAIAALEKPSLGQYTRTPVGRPTIGVGPPCISVTKPTTQAEKSNNIFDASSFISVTNCILQNSVAALNVLQSSSRHLKTNIIIILNDLNRSTDKNIQATYYSFLSRVLYDSPSLLWANRSLAGKIYDSYYSAGSKITEEEIYMRSYYNVYLRAVVDRLENLVDINAQSSVPEFLIDWLPNTQNLLGLLEFTGEYSAPQKRLLIAYKVISDLPPKALLVVSVHMLKVSVKTAVKAVSEKFIWQQLFVHTLMSVIVDGENNFCTVVLKILSWSFGYVLQLDNKPCDRELISGQPPLTSRLRSSIRNMKSFGAEDKVRRLLSPCFQTCKFGVSHEVMSSAVQTLCSQFSAIQKVSTSIVPFDCGREDVKFNVSSNSFAECLYWMVSNC